MTTIALYNLKGGVGKTASCVNLAYLAAADGYNTLIWDTDQQGSASYYYKVKAKQYQYAEAIYAKNAAVKDHILPTTFEHIHILPAVNNSTAVHDVNLLLSNSKNPIKNILKQVSGTYEFVFIDCPPGFSQLTQHIIDAVDYVLMPVIPTTLSVRSYHIVKVYMKENKLDAQKLTCFFTMVDSRKSLHQNVMKELHKDKRFFNTYIPYLSDVEKMGVYRAPIMEYANSSYAATCYRQLWAEIKEGLL